MSGAMSKAEFMGIEQRIFLLGRNRVRDVQAQASRQFAIPLRMLL